MASSTSSRWRIWARTHSPLAEKPCWRGGSMSEIKVPSAATLKKYGLSAEEWLQLLADQGNVCFICQKYPSTGRLCVDHYHVPKWKSLPPEQRKLWIRGILC